MHAPLIQQRLSERFGTPVELMQIGLTDGGQNKILLFCFRPHGREPFLVCRLSRTLKGIDMLRREAEARRDMLEKLPPALAASVPWVQTEEAPSGFCLIEPYISGERTQAPQTLVQIQAYAERAMDWLRPFRQATQLRTFSPDGLERVAGSQLASLRSEFEGPVERAGLEAMTPYLAALKGVAPCGVHGDFWRGNLRLQGQDLRIIDWEYARAQGSPYFDALLCLVALVRDLPGDPLTWFERCFLVPGDYSRLFGRLLGRLVPDEARQPAMALTLALVLGELVRRDRQMESEGGRSPHHPFLERLLRQQDPVASVMRSLWPKS